MAANNLTDAQITTVLTNASQVVGTFYHNFVTRFPAKKPSELGMTDLFTKEIGCYPQDGRAFHVSFTSAIDDETDMRENQHGADFILSFGRTHMHVSAGGMQEEVTTQYQIYIQAKKVKVVNGHEEVDFFYQSTFNGQQQLQASRLEASSVGLVNNCVNRSFYVVYKDNGVCIIPIHSLRQQMNLNNQDNRTVWAWANNRFQNPAANFFAGL